MKWYNSSQVFDHFYNCGKIHYDEISFIANFLSCLMNVSMNGNPVANIIFSLRDGIVPTDLDISISPSTDPAVRSLIEQIRTEFPIQSSYPDSFKDNDIFDSIIPNRSQFGAELDSYIDALGSAITKGISDVKSYEASQKGGD